METISRSQACTQGLNRYFTGEPCKNGHISERYVVNYRCIKCAREDGGTHYRNWFERNKEKAVASRRFRENKAYATSQEYRITVRLRHMLWRTMNSTGQEKKAGTQKLLGYSRESLCVHIERQFEKGMSWDNYGEWHIDHITSITEHVMNGETDPAVINCLSNLRPMWARENIAKGARRTHLL